MKPIEKVRYCLIETFKLLYVKNFTVRCVLDRVTDNFDEFIEEQVFNSLPGLPLPRGFEWLANIFPCGKDFLVNVSSRAVEEFINSLIDSTKKEDSIILDELRKIKESSSEIAKMGVEMALKKETSNDYTYN